MDRVKVSVIIPHFNSPLKLRRLLNSIAGEIAGDDVEAIVVDDRSTAELDELAEVKSDFDDKNVLFMDNNCEKKGAGVSRNLGMKYAKGEWLLFADADDFFVKNWYEEVSKYITSDCDIVFFKPISLNEVSGKAGKREKNYAALVEKYSNGEENAETAIRYSFNVPWSKLIRKSLVDANDISFDDTMCANDTMFSIKTGYYAHKIIADQQVIYCVTENEGTLTGSMSEEKFLIRTSVFIRKYRFLKEKLSDVEWKYLNLDANPLKRMYRVIQNKYGCAAVYRCYCLFREADVPVFTKQGLMYVVKGLLK